jgi:hypothetical protein
LLISLSWPISADNGKFGKKKNKGKNAGDKWQAILLTGSNSIRLGRSEANLYF